MPWVQLPDVVRQYQEAHDDHDVDRALSGFDPDATVFDDGQEHRGADEIRAWLVSTATQFNFTRTLLDVEAAGDQGWLVTNRLEGDFPGGRVDLRYRFTLRGDLIHELVIAP